MSSVLFVLPFLPFLPFLPVLCFPGVACQVQRRQRQSVVRLEGEEMEMVAAGSWIQRRLVEHVLETSSGPTQQEGACWGQYST